MNNFHNKQVGAFGEEFSAKYLEGIGYKILDRNWHFSKNCELDIVAKEGNTLVFVEVKTRSTTSFGHPLEAITQAKLKKVYTAAIAYMQQTKEKYKNYRIDAISITGLKDPKIEHLKSIGFD
ncbi:MAG: YraN family protein [Candidatus Gastranaerophilales bacterium]|nr:YraN family protein [Candidatus Gastranaerophilales bacterium]